jgi:DNA-binding CsgD family transcriptional regulator
MAHEAEDRHPCTVMRDDGMPTSDFVGRERELRILESLLDEAASSRGRGAMLVGEPGIGKTRLARELAAVARAGGAAVLWGTCAERETPPFGPWVDAADEHVAAARPDELRARLGTSLPVLAELVPALAERLPDLAPPTELAPSASRVRAYEALSRLLLDAAAGSPLVLVLDDLQWADAASLDLLGYAGRGLRAAPVVLVGSFRPTVGLDHPLAAALADLGRQLPVRRLRLAPLAPTETGSLVAAILGQTPSVAAVQAIHRDTGGNPFFAAELTRHLLEEGHDLASGSLDLPPAVPDSVRDAIGRRLSRLSGETVRLLSLACCFGGPFEFGELQALADLAEEPLLDAIDEALAAGMIATAGGERYTFAHSLVRQTLYDELSPSRRARLHRRAAQALERAHPGQELAYAAELARQYERSRSLPGAASGIRYAIAAAESARARSAYVQALTHLQTARELAVEGDATVRAEVQSRLAIAEAEALRERAAYATIAEALDCLKEAGAAPGSIAQFLARATWALEEAGAAADRVESLVAHGLRLCGSRHDLTWARLKLAERPLEELRVGDVVAGRWLGFDSRAVAVAREAGGDRDFAKTLELMDWRTRAETDELRMKAGTMRDASAAIHVLTVVMRSLLFQHGAFSETEQVAGELEALSERHGSYPGVAYALVHRAWAQHARGEAEEALRSLRRADEVVVRLGEGHRLHGSVRFLHWVAFEREADGASRESFALEAARNRGRPRWMALLHLSLAARAFSEAGNDGGAEALLADLVPVLAELEPTTLNHNGAVAHATLAAWLLDAREHAAVLRSLALALIDAGVGDYPGTSRELAVAQAAALAGDTLEALDYLQRARVVLARGGQRPLLETVADLERRLRTRTPPRAVPGEAPAGLTPREVEILRAVAAGRSNAEIAAALVLSVHTVERHVANVYRKIGAHNRAEATGYALRAGLA